MTSKILPMGTMLTGYLGAISSILPTIAILTSSSLRSRPMFQTIANLALSESWFLFCAGLLGTTNVVGAKMTPAVCAAFQSHNISVGIGSRMALFVLCVERYVAIVHGLHYETLLTPRRKCLLLVFPWFVMGVSWVTFTSLANAMILQTFGPSPLHCRFLEVMPLSLRLAATGTPMVIDVAIVVLNIIVSRVVVRHQRTIRHQRCMVNVADQENISAYLGVLKVTAIYILFQTPANLLFLLELLWKPQSPWLIAVSTVGVVLMPAIDGWFFGYYNTKLRRRYAFLFGCWSLEEDAPRSGGTAAGVVHAVQQLSGGTGRSRTARVSPETSGRPARHAEAVRAATPIWVVPQVPGEIVGGVLPQAHVTVAVEVLPQVSVQVVGEEKTHRACSAP